MNAASLQSAITGNGGAIKLSVTEFFKAFHILNVFDIPKGAIREADPNVPLTDYTLWTSAADTLNIVYYYKTYITQAVESVDVRQAVADLEGPTVIQMESGFQVRDRTAEFSN